MPRMISTNSITGTGFMKCMPIKRSGRSVAAARRVMDSDDVLEAMMASGGSTELTSRKISLLIVSFSLAASMAKPASLIKERLSAGCRRDSAASLSASVILPPATWRAKLPVMVAMPASMRSCEISLSRTREPERAKTCAIPHPICPAPIMPTVFKSDIKPPDIMRQTAKAGLTDRLCPIRLPVPVRR